jgi:hypothetical protein
LKFVLRHPLISSIKYVRFAGKKFDKRPVLYISAADHGTFYTASAASKSNAIEVPQLHLPKGGGAIKGIDEKFSVNASNGSSSVSLPLPFTTAKGVPAISYLQFRQRQRRIRIGLVSGSSFHSAQNG